MTPMYIFISLMIVGAIATATHNVEISKLFRIIDAKTELKEFTISGTNKNK